MDHIAGFLVDNSIKRFRVDDSEQSVSLADDFVHGVPIVVMLLVIVTLGIQFDLIGFSVVVGVTNP